MGRDFDQIPVNYVGPTLFEPVQSQSVMEPHPRSPKDLQAGFVQGFYLLLV
jgi:hypothetical protein